VRRLHVLVSGDAMPPPLKKPRCRGCSLCEVCLPEVVANRDCYAEYVRSLYEGLPDA
jgi:hypothetical protein